MITFDILGYIGTFFVIISFLSNSIVYLRILNALGALLVTIYALEKSAFPVVILDGTIFLINTFQLIYYYKKSNK